MTIRRTSRRNSRLADFRSVGGSGTVCAPPRRSVGPKKPPRKTTAKPAAETVKAEDRALTLERRMQARDAYRALIDGLDAQYFITFNFGYTIKPLNAFDRMKEFCAALERKALGRNWCKHTGDERLVVVGFAEHLDSNSHWHAVARVPAAMARVLETSGEPIWLDRVKRGQLHIERTTDPNTVRNYATKRLHQVDGPDKVFIYCPEPLKR